MTAAHLCRTHMYWLLIYWKPVRKNEYHKRISLLALKISRKLNGWLRPVQIIKATYLLDSNTATINGMCCIGKAEQPAEKGRKNWYKLCSLCQHFVFVPGFCSAGPLGSRAVWPAVWECWCQWQHWFCTALGEVRKMHLWQAVMYGTRRLCMSHPHLANPASRYTCTQV